VCALACASGAVVVPSAVAAAAPRVSGVDPGAVPDVALDRSIHSEQVALVTAAAARVAAAAETAARVAAAREGAEVATLRAERSEAQAAAVALSSSRAAVSAASARWAAAEQVRRRDRAAVSAALREIQALAVAWYVAGPAAQVAPTPRPDAARQADAAAELLVVTDSVESSERSDLVAARTAGLRSASARAVLARDQGIEAADRSRSSAAERSVVFGRRALAAAATRRRVSVERAALAARQERSVLLAFDGPEGNGPAPVPTILGRPALSAAELAAWYDQSGYVDLAGAPIQRLAEWYIEEGDAEGVRGDIAFAQAIVETGGFSSPDAVVDNNYAGIGHCDTCAAGFRFASPRAGVRGQIQLLRTYAQPGLTAAQMADPPVLAALDPSAQVARGCCRTWNALTGRWATDPDYGLTVLAVYQSMLSSALTGDG
jgi:hypothetical protein